MGSTNRSRFKVQVLSMRRRTDRHKAVHAAGVFSSVIFSRLRNGDGQNVSQQKVVHPE
jgi:hypothetical protein